MGNQPPQPQQPPQPSKTPILLPLPPPSPLIHYYDSSYDRRLRKEFKLSPDKEISYDDREIKIKDLRKENELLVQKLRVVNVMKKDMAGISYDNPEIEEQEKQYIRDLRKLYSERMKNISDEILHHEIFVRDIDKKYRYGKRRKSVKKRRSRD